MARNRTEFKSRVNTLISAIVNITKHRQVLNDELADSINFRKDVKGLAITATVSDNNIDFTTNDLVTIDGATNNLDLVLTILNTQDGEDSKYIRVVKDADKDVTFSGATDISHSDTRKETEVFYRVTNKNGNIFVEALKNQTIELVYEIGDWDMDTLAATTVTHTLSDFKKIRSVSAMIRNDADTIYTPLNSYTTTINGGVGNTTSTLISLSRAASPGLFDQATYSTTSYNRGWVYVRYAL